MLIGQLLITIDIDLVNDTLTNGVGKVLVLSENQDNKTIFSSPNVIPASILLPPYESVMADLDGNTEMANIEYINYLCRKEPDMFICAILAALLKGINILIYIGKDEAEMPFVSSLIRLLYDQYGITIGTEHHQFMYNKAYDAVIDSKLYLYELITYQDFFILYPETVMIPDYLIPKLIVDMNPYVEVQTTDNYKMYFEGYKNRIKSNNNQLLINPISRG